MQWSRVTLAHERENGIARCWAPGGVSQVPIDLPAGDGPTLAGLVPRSIDLVQRFSLSLKLELITMPLLA